MKTKIKLLKTGDLFRMTEDGDALMLIGYDEGNYIDVQAIFLTGDKGKSWYFNEDEEVYAASREDVGIVEKIIMFGHIANGDAFLDPRDYGGTLIKLDAGLQNNSYMILGPHKGKYYTMDFGQKIIPIELRGTCGWTDPYE